FTVIILSFSLLPLPALRSLTSFPTRRSSDLLGYSLLVFVYDKTDNPKTASGVLNVLHTIFVSESRTSDFQMTKGLREILDNQGKDRKSTRLNSSHQIISYAVFCLKKKKKHK